MNGVFIRDMTKNLMVPMVEFQASSIESSVQFDSILYSSQYYLNLQLTIYTFEKTKKQAPHYAANMIRLIA